MERYEINKYLTGFSEKIGIVLFFALIIARVVYVKYKKIQF